MTWSTTSTGVMSAILVRMEVKFLTVMTSTMAWKRVVHSPQESSNRPFTRINLYKRNV